MSSLPLPQLPMLCAARQPRQPPHLLYTAPPAGFQTLARPDVSLAQG